MFAKLFDWLDHRTGCRTLVSALLIEHIPGGAKWRYVWGSTLAFVFSLQLLTGILLMTAYSPGATTAWGSVYFIQYEMDFGWLIRGLHHFGSQTMVVLLGLHMLQVVIAGAHLAPREINWWLGLGLMGVVLALSLTGYLLPWDQKGYWATQVATNIAGNLPGIGAWLAKIIVGGSEYGHHTVSRFYALHVGILPPLLIVLLIAHLAVFRRHGVTTPRHAEGEGWFWPDQAFRDLLACLLIFGIMLSLVVFGHGHRTEPVSVSEDKGWYERIAQGGREGRGANLDAPADPSRPYPARPEWYFLFLFQLLKYFEGDLELLGTVVIPNGVGVLLALLPLFGYGVLRRPGHALGILVVTALLAGVGTLTCLALADDMINPQGRWLMIQLGTKLVPALGGLLLVVLLLLAIAGGTGLRKPVFFLGGVLLAAGLAGVSTLGYLALQADSKTDLALREGRSNPFETDVFPPPLREFLDEHMTAEDKKPVEKNLKFREDLRHAEAAAARAITLAGTGIPSEGPVELLRRDPMTQGKALFGQHCATCHTFGREFENKTPSASDLDGFGSQHWVLRLLTQPGHEDFFGRTKLTGMADFITEKFPNLTVNSEEESKLSAEEQDMLRKDRADLQQIARWLSLHPRANHEARDKEEFKKGQALFKKRECQSCHAYEGEGGTRRTRGPELTGYGDAEWLRLMLMAPHDPRRYGLKNTMPAFRDLEGPVAELTRQELELRRHQLVRDELAARKLDDTDPKAETIRKQAHEAGKVSHLSDVDRELIIRFLIRDSRVVFGGSPISGPRPRK